MIKYTKEQISEMEDVIINKLNPIYGHLDLFLGKGKISHEQIEKMMQSIEYISFWIRSLRRR